MFAAMSALAMDSMGHIVGEGPLINAEKARLVGEVHSKARNRPNHRQRNAQHSSLPLLHVNLFDYFHFHAKYPKRGYGHAEEFTGSVLSFPTSNTSSLTFLQVQGEERRKGKISTAAYWQETTLMEPLQIEWKNWKNGELGWCP